jgi:hypothetical protein
MVPAGSVVALIRADGRKRIGVAWGSSTRHEPFGGAADAGAAMADRARAQANRALTAALLRGRLVARTGTLALA